MTLRKELIIGCALMGTLLGGFALGAAYTPGAYKANILQSTSRSWNGQTIVYAKGDAEITTATIVIKKGEALPWHIHEVPMAVYVLDGELTLEDDKGNKQVIKEGQSAIESVNTSHRGIATGDEDTELFAIYLGNKTLKNTKLDPHKNH